MIYFGDGKPCRLVSRWYATWEEKSFGEWEQHNLYDVLAIAFRCDDKLHLIEMLDDGMLGL